MTAILTFQCGIELGSDHHITFGGEGDSTYGSRPDSSAEVITLSEASRFTSRLERRGGHYQRLLRRAYLRSIIHILTRAPRSLHYQRPLSQCDYSCCGSLGLALSAGMRSERGTLILKTLWQGATLATRDHINGVAEVLCLRKHLDTLHSCTISTKRKT